METELGPIGFDDYQGQKQLKDRLKTHIAAAKRDDRLIDHVFLSAPPGSGKTALAQVIANELGTQMRDFIMPIQENVLKAILLRWEGVILLDEIHRASKTQQESLLTVLKGGFYQPKNGAKIHAAHNITFVGATTEPENVIAPLRERFQIRPFFEAYTDEDMARIVKGMADRVDVPMSFKMAHKLGAACAGVPRNAESLISMTRDLGTNDWTKVLAACDLTEDGLTREHREYLKFLALHNGQAGLAPLQAMLRMEKATIVNLERLLFTKGLITYSRSAGRELTSDGYKQVDLPNLDF